MFFAVSEFRFACFRGLHKNDPRNHTKSHEQRCFVWLRGSFSLPSQSLKTGNQDTMFFFDLDTGWKPAVRRQGVRSKFGANTCAMLLTLFMSADLETRERRNRGVGEMF